MKKNLNNNCKLLLTEATDFVKMIGDVFRYEKDKTINSVDEVSKNLIELHKQVSVTLNRDHEEFLKRIKFDATSGTNPYDSWGYKWISTWFPSAPAKWNIGIKDVFTPFKGGGLRYDVNEVNISPTQWVLAIFDRHHTLFKHKEELNEFVHKPEMIEIRRISMRLRDDFGIPEKEIKVIIRGIMDDVADSLTKTGKIDFQDAIKARYEDAVKIAKSHVIPGELVTSSNAGGDVKKIEDAIKETGNVVNTKFNDMLTAFQKAQEVSDSKVSNLESTIGVFKYGAVIALFFALIYAVYKVATKVKSK